MNLIEEVLSEIDEHPASDVRLGYRYTGVSVEGRIGLAYTMAELCDPPARVGELVGERLCGLALSDNLMEASIGTAAINAHLNPSGSRHGNVFEDVLEKGKKHDKIAVIGRFPFIGELEGLGPEVLVFERRYLPGCLPESAERELVPTCDMVVITGTSFINKTLEPLLELSQGYTMVIGPSTPLSEVLLERGADLIAGANGAEPRILDVVSQGGGTREFMDLVEPVIMER